MYRNIIQFIVTSLCFYRQTDCSDALWPATMCLWNTAL